MVGFRPAARSGRTWYVAGTWVAGEKASRLTVPACPDNGPRPLPTAAVYTALAWTEKVQKGTNTKLVEEFSNKLEGARRLLLWKAKNRSSASFWEREGSITCP